MLIAEHNEEEIEESMKLQEAYLLLQENCGIKVGDTVRVLRKAEDYENGWDNEWNNNEMDEAVGKTTTVERIDRNGIGLKNDRFKYLKYPFFVLEKLAPDWTEKLCEEVPALCYVRDSESTDPSIDFINNKINGAYAFNGENCNWKHAELVPKELLQAILERYYD